MGSLEATEGQRQQTNAATGEDWCQQYRISPETVVPTVGTAGLSSLQLIQDSDSPSDQGRRPMIPDHPISIEAFRFHFQNMPTDAITNRQTDVDDLSYTGSELNTVRRGGSLAGMEVRGPGSTSVFERQANGELLETTNNADGSRQTFRYDASGRPLTVDAEGRTLPLGRSFAKLDIDQQGNVQLQTRWQGEESTYRIQNDGLRSEVTTLNRGTEHQQESSYITAGSERHISRRGGGEAHIQSTNLQTGETVRTHDRYGYRREVHDTNGNFTYESYTPKNGLGMTYVWRPGRVVEVENSL